MKGFKDTTKTQYTTGAGCGPKGAAKTSQVMATFKAPVKKAAGGMVGKPPVMPAPDRKQPVPVQNTIKASPRAAMLRRPENTGGPTAQRMPRR